MEIGTVRLVDIEEEMKGAYLDYAMSVITARALPDVRDGLKPVQRRILYAMNEMGLRHDRPYKKSARVVGDVLGRYHPHGDQAVYDALVRMAQDFSMRYTLVDGQGNFGCFTGDTKIELLDGTEKSFAELAELGSDEVFYVYSVDENGRIVVGEGRNARVTRRNARLIELTLDNGETIRCTPDHKFMLRDGTYKSAEDLTQDDSLMPGYFDTIPVKDGLNEYLRVLQPNTGEYEFVHHLADEFNAQRGHARQFADVYDITVDKHHNFLLACGVFVHNSVDGDPPAAMRYTEARLTKIAEELLIDIDKETIDFVDNFDGTLKEPSVLPGKLPNLLLNGASGIAVGMATNIPPHNLNELCNAIIYLIDHWDDIDEISVDDLIKLVPGPDFPTGATILGAEGIREAYTRGKGRVVMRAKAHIEEMKGGRQRILVTELPYQVNKATLIERIADLVRNKKIDTIADLRDESDRQGMSIVIELKRGAEPKKTLNQLLKYTQMQSTFGVNMLALVDGEPRVLPLKRSLQLYVNHRQEVIRRRSEFELARAKHRAHVLEGLRIALKNLDEVINTIRRSPNADTARERLMKRFKLTEIQAQAILDMQLRRLAALEREKIEVEYKELIKQIAALEDLLKNPRKILYVIKDDLKELQKTYGDARRTKIMAEETEEFAEEDLIPDEQVLITLTQRGYVKRMPATTYRPQRTGGRGITGVVTREQDAVAQMLSARTLDNLLIFSNQGKVYTQKVHQLPDASRQAAGLPINNLIPLDKDEYITQMLPVRTFEEDACLVMATRGGKIKRTILSEFESVRPSGIIALILDEGDELIAVRLTHGADDIFIVTEKGQALRFKDDQVRPMGRNAAGVNAIKLAPDDHVTGMDVASRGNEMLIVTSKGFGKRTPLKAYPVKGRYTGGVVTLDPKKMDTTGPIVSARIVTIEDEVSLISADGMVLRIAIKSFSRQGRPARGTRVMDLKKGDTVVAVARLRTRSLEQTGSKATVSPPDDDDSDEPQQLKLSLTESGEKPKTRSRRSFPTSSDEAGKKKAAPKASRSSKVEAPARSKSARKTATAKSSLEPKKTRQAAKKPTDNKKPTSKRKG